MQIDNKHKLRDRILRAGVWTLGGHILSQLIRFAGNLIMTRLLIPEMFGVMALANVIIIGLAMFSDIGLNQGVIQSRRGHDPIYLNTVWTVQILRGGLIWLIALGVGVAIHFLGTWQLLPTGSAYADPILPYIIAILSLNALIDGFASTRLATANRNLALGRLTLIELSSQMAALIFMISWALVNRTVWALVFGGLFANLLRVIMSHLLLQGEKNTLHWDQEAFMEIFGFGKWLFLTSILGFFSANGDRLLLGALISSTTLGNYAIAFFMVNSFGQIISKLIGSVAFPAFSEIVRLNREALKRNYYKLRLPLDITVLLTTGMLYSSGHLLIQLLYDDRYSQAGRLLEILSISLFELRFSLAGQCFMAMGMPRLLAPIIFIRVVTLYGLMPLVYESWGLEGSVWLIASSVLFTIPLTIYFKIKHNLFDLRHELLVLPILGVGYFTGSLINQVVLLMGWMQ